MNRFKTLIHKFQKSPDAISINDYRFYVLLKVVNSVGLMTHFLWIFLFYFLDIITLSLINIASVCFFILAFYLNEKGKFFLSITVGMLEVIAHQIVCSTFIGVAAGFQYYIIIACILPFLLPAGRNLFKGLLLISSLTAFIYIVYFIVDKTPLYQLDPTTILYLGYSNIILAFTFLGIWGIYFSIAILSTENKLELEILKSEKLVLKIKKKTAELEKKNKGIQDSLNYSEKIQRSILPQAEEIQKHLINSFIYFEPKDIIGGDFYWFYNNKEHCYIAAIDCTGHGVPGALMSMTIYSLLNEIMIKEMLTDPGEILGLLHEKVSIALQQQKGDEYSQDGCDATLCRLDLNSKELVFSGAQNDLLIYNGKELQILRAEKQSIGGFSMLGDFEEKRIFTSQTISASNDDLIILTTDGLPDQLNVNDEAFGVKEFKKTLHDIYSKNAIEMKNLFESRISEWKTGVQQQDDFLLLGFKLD